MATGRKGPSVPSSRKRLSEPTGDGPADDEFDVAGAADDAAGAPLGSGVPPDDLVAVVRGLAAAVADHGLTELIVDTPDVTFTLRRGGVATVAMPMQMPAMPMQMPAMPATMPAMSTMQIPTMPMAPSAVGGQASGAFQVPPAAPEEKVHLVTSPFVGTFYRRPNPDAAEYVKINDKVSKGAVLCLVEAMKLMNEIEADLAGTVVGVLAEDGAPVEYGQPLFKLAPA